MAELNIQERRAGEVTILDLQGDITIGAGGGMLKDRIGGLAAAGRRKILLNLSRVRYVDSSGLGSLIYGFNAVSREGGQIKLLNLTERVRELMIITKLVTVFDTFEEEQAALTSYGSC